ncbi:MAG TPA: ROK family protein [Niabella sp.]|nr:ROK family protein [Niabella sp.]HOZ98475.1 ROK family protein [Niabella sp.]HQW16003.1 ROK family protein [Niabella sp.]HQX21245.1 ROK family protein [Niabella sp.]HQX42073.1 ROK family protein [Niabella sp.]
MPTSITLTIDIGGSKIKACTLNKSGKIIQDYIKVETPNPANPKNIFGAILDLVKDFKFDRISVGFPGYVRDGIVHTAPNLDNASWAGVNLAEELMVLLGKPARVINDADLLGLGCVSGKGFEMMITLGTGFGTAIYLDGKVLPHLEISHHPIHKGEDYDVYIGEAAYKNIGRKKWNKRMEYVLSVLKTVFNYDRLYIGGGQAKKLDVELDQNMIIVSNIDGINGGVKLWAQ